MSAKLDLLWLNNKKRPHPASAETTPIGRRGLVRCAWLLWLLEAQKHQTDSSEGMETLYRVPFTILEVPQLKLKKPGFIKMPSSYFVFCLVLLSYFMVTGGVIYDVIVEPPSIGSQTDEHGHSRPVAFMQYRVNGQYIMEGLASSFLFTLGGLGFIMLERSNGLGISKLNRTMMLALSLFCIFAAFLACRVFMGIKLP